jgi:hypothetical protein
MADDGALRAWVSDQLFALLGFAESSLVAFVIALGAPRAALRCAGGAAVRRSARAATLRLMARARRRALAS